MRCTFMGQYVERNLGRNENIVKKAEKNWLTMIFNFLNVRKVIGFLSFDLAITNKRVIGKTGLISTKALDAPLNKVQNASVANGLFGKIFNYGTVRIDTAAGTYTFYGIKNPNNFKTMLMNQIDQYEEDKIKQQAEEMAKSMASVLNK